MNIPNDKDEFLDYLDQAIFETRDLLFSAKHEGDEDDFGGFVPVYEQLVQHLEKLPADILTGRPSFGGGQEPFFMPLIQRRKSQLPIYSLLEAMNTAQKQGF